MEISPPDELLIKPLGDNVVLTCTAHAADGSEFDAKLRWYKEQEEITETSGRCVDIPATGARRRWRLSNAHIATIRS